MAATMVIPIPDAIQDRVENLTRENFYLWMFVSTQDLWEEAKEFLSENAKTGKSFDGWWGSGLAYADLCRPFHDVF